MLGEELHISGAFIYNGLRRFHEMKQLGFTDEVFEVLYNLSVGLERLLKIAVVLVDHNDVVDQEELEKSLITHNHLKLLDRIKKKVSVNLGAPQVELLTLLSVFYKTIRYDRFSLSSVYNFDREIKAICDLFRKYLNVDIPRERSIFALYNEDRYRRFIHRTVIKISSAIFKVVRERAYFYTHELRHGSKAETIFLRKIDISDEDILWKELLVFFMNTKASSGYLNFLRGINPLDFDPEEIGDYLDCFKSDASKSFVMDEIEHYYSEMGDSRKERLEMMKIIGDPEVCFVEPDDDGCNGST